MKRPIAKSEVKAKAVHFHSLRNFPDFGITPERKRRIAKDVRDERKIQKDQT